MTTDQDSSASAPSQPVSFLEQALWTTLGDGRSLEDSARGWLGLQCRFLPGSQSAVLVMAETPDKGPFAPVANWPTAEPIDPDLSSAVELALAERRTVIEHGDENGDAGEAVVGYPVMLGNKLVAAIGLKVHGVSPQKTVQLIRWGAGTLESILRREASRQQTAQVGRISAALEMLTGPVEQKRFKPACTALVTDLSLRFDCDQVAIGFCKDGAPNRVAALSHSASFGKRMALVRRFGEAMDEAVDQEAAVIWPASEDWEYRITHAHRELSDKLGGGTILTVPLHRDGKMLGAVTLQRPQTMPFDEDVVLTVDTIAGLAGPILEEKRDNDRLIFSKVATSISTQFRRLLGPRYFGRKLASILAIAIFAFFATAKGDYRVSAPAVLEGEVQRALVAPLDGFVAAEYAKAGEVVAQGEVLARLDDRDLVLERLRRTAEEREKQAEYDRALAENNRVDARILQAQLAEVRAQLSLVDAQLARTELKAPFDGLVISGDLSQSIGSGVRRGDELFTVAPLDGYRVILQVGEGDLRDMAETQSGTLVLSAIPDLQLPYEVERITPIATAEEGRNFFRVEARLTAGDPRLRPGMEGVGKTFVDERLLVAKWTRGLVDWARLAFWRWMP